MFKQIALYQIFSFPGHCISNQITKPVISPNFQKTLGIGLSHNCTMAHAIFHEMMRRSRESENRLEILYPNHQDTQFAKDPGGTISVVNKRSLLAILADKANKQKNKTFDGATFFHRTLTEAIFPNFFQPANQQR